LTHERQARTEAEEGQAALTEELERLKELGRQMLQ